MKRTVHDVPNGPNYKSWRCPQYSPQQFANLTSIEKLEHLCHLGHLAPSTHNTQPWRFFIDAVSSTITVYLDHRAVLPASDVMGRQAIISVGCAIGNILIGSKALGLAPTIKYTATNKEIHASKKKQRIQNNSRYTSLATLTFTKTNIHKQLTPLYSVIFTRKVTRAEFDPQKSIPNHIIQCLQQATDGKMTRIHIVSDTIRKHTIAEFQAQADSFVINSPAFRKELGEWLLPNTTNSYTGMPGIGFGLQGVQAQRIHDGLLNRKPLEPEDGLRFALAGKIGIEKSPIICCITIARDDPRHWLETGITMERMFLKSIEQGMVVAVHAGIVEVALVNKMFAMTLGTLRRLSALFRIGYIKDDPQVLNRPHSPRLPLGMVLLDRATIGQVSSR